MSEPVTTFRQLMAPITPEQFFEEYYDKKALYIPGNAEKVAEICSWDHINDLLQMVSNWSDKNLKIVIDTKTVQPASFCERAADRNRLGSLRPKPYVVSQLFEQGATVVLDLIENMNPGILSVTEAIQMATGFRVSCNAYCSRQQRKAFDSHFDSMDVFALHIEGTKTWRIYKGRFENPLEQGGYDNPSYSPEYLEKAKGELLMEIEMKPGDMLYLPKGVYHDALASTEACLHLSFGTTQPSGINVINWLTNSLSSFAIMRKALPAYNEEEAHDAQVKQITDCLAELLQEPTLASQFRKEQRAYAFEGLSNINFPGPEPLKRFRVLGLGVKLKRRGSDWRLTTPKEAHTISADDQPKVEWILARDHFDTKTMAAAFQQTTETDLDALLTSLMEKKIIDPFYTETIS